MSPLKRRETAEYVVGWQHLCPCGGDLPTVVGEQVVPLADDANAIDLPAFEPMQCPVCGEATVSLNARKIAHEVGGPSTASV